MNISLLSVFNPLVLPILKIKIKHLICRVEIFTKFAPSKLKFNSNKIENI